MRNAECGMRKEGIKSNFIGLSEISEVTKHKTGLIPSVFSLDPETIVF